MAQRHRARAAHPALSNDAGQPALPESTRVLSPQSQRLRPREITPAGDQRGGNGSADVILRAGHPGSPLQVDDMDIGRGWPSGIRRGGKVASNWFNTVMSILLLVLAAFGYARTPLPGSASLRAGLLAAASRSPFACEGGTAKVVTMQGATLPDPRSLSGLLNAEEPPNLMVTMPADPEKKALAEKLVREEKARWKAEWREAQRLKREAKAKAEAERSRAQDEERKRKQRQTEEKAQRTPAGKVIKKQPDAKGNSGSDRSSRAPDRAQTRSKDVAA